MRHRIRHRTADLGRDAASVITGAVFRVLHQALFPADRFTPLARGVELVLSQTPVDDDCRVADAVSVNRRICRIRHFVTVLAATAETVTAPVVDARLRLGVVVVVAPYTVVRVGYRVVAVMVFGARCLVREVSVSLTDEVSLHGALLSLLGRAGSRLAVTIRCGPAAVDALYLLVAVVVRQWSAHPGRCTVDAGVPRRARFVCFRIRGVTQQDSSGL